MEVITGEDLQQRQMRTVADALRLGQGLTVFSNGGPGTTIERTHARKQLGADARADRWRDHEQCDTLGSFDFANLTTDNIERIEILRGARACCGERMRWVA